ncbi:uncharacterized protein LOC102809854 [Saccoglossus kowalevskii]|uniref:Autophagy-related protein 27 n=1 Tax=Saccoglossus kowalevskii TaxID=10224 RepID=A0ABM0MTP9_SACKO|nr:PREDICTED: uncharacterized protein LOC102809854 [Saccoglossus kowalevskii]
MAVVRSMWLVIAVEVVILSIWVPSSQSSTTLPHVLCGIEGYDTNNLTSALYWTFSLPGQCYHKDNSTSTSCNYYLAFCQELDSTGQPFNETCDEAGACLQDSKEGSHNIGNYDVHSNPFSAMDNGLGFYYSFPSNDTGQKDCDVAHTLMYFVCGENPWFPTAGEPSEIPGEPEVTFLSSCVYNITVRYSGACLPPQPIPVPKDSSSSLSAGSILLIIFIPAIALYFIIGILINKIQGHQGVELLPHHEFWTSLPEYISDGIKYAWECVTCQRKKEEGYESI